MPITIQCFSGRKKSLRMLLMFAYICENCATNIIRLNGNIVMHTMVLIYEKHEDFVIVTLRYEKKLQSLQTFKQFLYETPSATTIL